MCASRGWTASSAIARPCAVAMPEVSTASSSTSSSRAWANAADGRRIEPGELRGFGDTGHREVERERGQVGVQNLGRRLLEQMRRLVLRPETIADARRRSAGAPAALIGR